MQVEQALLRALPIAGWLEQEEIKWIASAAQTRRVIIEIGCWKGRSTKALALCTPGVVYAIDHWEGSPSELATTYREIDLHGSDSVFSVFLENLEREIAAGKVIPIKAHSNQAICQLSSFAGASKPDMVFIDGDHQYVQVKRDIENYRPLLSPRGLLSGHDYSESHPGVVQAVDETIPNFKKGPGTIWHVEV